MTDRDGYEYEIKYSGTMDRQGTCGHTSSYQGNSVAAACMAQGQQRMPRHPTNHEQPPRRRKNTS